MLLKLLVIIFTVSIGAAACHFLLIHALRRLPRWPLILALVLSTGLYVSLFFLRPVNVYVSDAVMLLSVASFCVILARGIKTAGSIISFSIAASVADVVSFTLGPTQSVMKAAERLDPGSLVNLLSFTIIVNGFPCPMVGVGDFVIIGICFLALRNIGVTPLLRFAVPTMGLLGAIAVGILAGGIYAVPFMAAVVISYLFFSHRLSTRVQTCQP